MRSRSVLLVHSVISLSFSSRVISEYILLFSYKELVDSPAADPRGGLESLVRHAGAGFVVIFAHRDLKENGRGSSRECLRLPDPDPPQA